MCIIAYSTRLVKAGRRAGDRQAARAAFAAFAFQSVTASARDSPGTITEQTTLRDNRGGPGGSHRTNGWIHGDLLCGAVPHSALDRRSRKPLKSGSASRTAHQTAGRYTHPRPDPGTDMGGREITDTPSTIDGRGRPALDRLLPVLYEELKVIARRHRRRERDDLTLNTTDLVHEAYAETDRPGPHLLAKSRARSRSGRTGHASCARGLRRRQAIA